MQAVEKTSNINFALSNDFDDNSDSDNSNEEANDCDKYSLIINDQPLTALKLMHYLKHYSELLFAWGETYKAIEASKIVANAFKLLCLFHPELFMF